MRSRILRTVIYSLGFLLLGCVTEQSYIDSNQQVRSLSFNKQEAAKSRLLLGLGYLRNNNYPQAKFNLDKALEFAPERADVHYSLAYYYQAVDETKLAESAYQTSLEIEPNNPDTLNNYGVFLCDSNQSKKALIQFKLAITAPSYTQVAESYENMALCVLKDNDFHNALNYLMSSYQHNPNRSSTLINLISVQYAMANYQQAFDLYKQYLFKFNESSTTLLIGYLLEQGLGRENVAKQYLVLLSEKYPSSRENLLLNANLLHEFMFEQRRRQFLEGLFSHKSTLKDIEPVVVAPIGEHPTSSDKAGLTEISPTLTVNPNSIHTVVGIGQTVSLPEEIIISEQGQNEGIEIIDRLPLLDINTDNVEIPRYTVQYGENLYRVSIKFNVQISTLMKWNKLTKPNINAGDKLYIQNPDVFYTVKETNNLSDIADELQIPLDKLMRWNNVTQNGIVAAGSRILKVEVEPLK